MKVFDNKLFIIDNFIFPETCKFLIDVFSNDLQETSKKGVFVSVYSNKKFPAKLVSGLNKIDEEKNIPNYNIAIDLFTSICTNIEKTVSNIFSKKLYLRSYLYSHMKLGSYNSIHADNYSEEYIDDFSAILYLSDSYDGGFINFPKIGQRLKPSPGTLIAFIGNDEMIHEVEEITGGDRINIICFLNKGENNEN